MAAAMSLTPVKWIPQELFIERGYVNSAAFGAEATRVGSNPVILGGGHRQEHGRTVFRVQFAARIALDYGGRLIGHHAGRFSVSLRTAGVSATRAGCSATVGSERDGRQQFQLATGGGPQGT